MATSNDMSQLADPSPRTSDRALPPMTDGAVRPLNVGGGGRRAARSQDAGEVDPAVLVTEACHAARLGLEQFARAYRFDADRLRDLEQGRMTMDSATKAYLLLIRAYPQFVRDKLCRLDRGGA